MTRSPPRLRTRAWIRFAVLPDHPISPVVEETPTLARMEQCEGRHFPLKDHCARLRARSSRCATRSRDPVWAAVPTSSGRSAAKNPSARTAADLRQKSMRSSLARAASSVFGANRSDTASEFAMRIEIHGTVANGGARRIVAEPVIVLPAVRRPNRPWRKAACAVRAHVVQNMFGAMRTKRAFVAADARVECVRRQRLVAMFACGSKLEHGWFPGIRVKKLPMISSAQRFRDAACVLRLFESPAKYFVRRGTETRCEHAVELVGAEIARSIDVVDQRLVDVARILVEVDRHLRVSGADVDAQ